MRLKVSASLPVAPARADAVRSDMPPCTKSTAKPGSTTQNRCCRCIPGTRAHQEESVAWEEQLRRKQSAQPRESKRRARSFSKSSARPGVAGTRPSLRPRSATAARTGGSASTRNPNASEAGLMS